jgi:hypothetical protein
VEAVAAELDRHFEDLARTLANALAQERDARAAQGLRASRLTPDLRLDHFQRTPGG